MTTANKTARKASTTATATARKANSVPSTTATKIARKASKSVKTATANPSSMPLTLEALIALIVATVAPSFASLETKLEALSENMTANRAQCEVLENIIVGIQTARLEQSNALLPVTAATDDPSDDDDDEPASDDPSYGELINMAIDSAIEGINTGLSKFVPSDPSSWIKATNVIHMCNHDLRAFCDQKTRSLIKAYVKANDVTLAEVSQHIVDTFEHETDDTAAKFSPLTKDEFMRYFKASKK